MFGKLIWLEEHLGRELAKPENLLKRIILSSSNEDSIVADFFAGSGTTGIVAERLNRRWIMTDIGRPASVAIQKRLIDNEAGSFLFKKLDEKDTKGSSLSLKSIDKVPFAEGKELICIELKDYILDIESVNINKKYKNLIYEIAEKDALSLIEYISIDPMYNGETFISRWQDYRRKENGYKINSRIELKVPKTEEKHQIFIKIVDIFGAETSVLKEI
jgi:adenine specific DNA methylase Mod